MHIHNFCISYYRLGIFMEEQHHFPPRKVVQQDEFNTYIV